MKVQATTEKFIFYYEVTCFVPPEEKYVTNKGFVVSDSNLEASNLVINCYGDGEITSFTIEYIDTKTTDIFEFNKYFVKDDFFRVLKEED